MNLPTLRLNLTLALVALYCLLDAAFMLVRVPPDAASGVPLGEILIVLFFLTLAADLHLAGAFLRTAPILPLSIWWFVALTQLGIGVAQYGMPAMRDGTSLIESLFLWIGFVVSAVPGAIPKIITWFRRILILSILITLTYPFRHILASVSPTVMTTHGLPLQLFFTYNLVPLIALVAAVHFIAMDVRFVGVKSSWLAAALMIFVAALLQERTIYLQILFLFGYMAIVRKGNPLKLIAPLSVAVALLLSVIALGIPIPGRVTQNVSLDFYVEHFLAIGGQANTTGTENLDVRGAASGVQERLLWWRVIWEHVTSTWSNMLFGLGYGISLVGLARDPGIDIVVREPHNSLVSALGRTGFVGLGAYVWLHISLAIVAVRTYLSYRAKGFDQTSHFIYLLGGLFAIYWIAAMGEDAFEKPFVSITYYFFFGVILNLSYRDARAPSRTNARR